MFNLSSHFGSKQTNYILLLRTPTTKISVPANDIIRVLSFSVPCHWSHHRPLCMPACNTAAIPVTHCSRANEFHFMFSHSEFKEGTRNFYLNALQLILGFHSPHLTVLEMVPFTSQTRRTPNKHGHCTQKMCV